MIIPYSDAIVKFCGRVSRFLSGNHGAVRGANMLFEYCEHRLDATRLANIGILRHSVFRSHNITPKAKTRPPLSTVRAGRLCLQPVEQRQTELFRSIYMFLEFLLRNIDDTAQHIIVLRPVNDRDITGVSSRLKVVPVYYTTVIPQVKRIPRGYSLGVESQGLGLQRRGLRISEIKQSSRPGWRKIGNMVAPKIILFRFVNDVVCSRNVI